MNWWNFIIEYLPCVPSDKTNYWSDGSEILCRTEELADKTADMIEELYRQRGELVLMNTGYYDPVEDAKDGVNDKYTGWYYVQMD